MKSILDLIVGIVAIVGLFVNIWYVQDLAIGYCIGTTIVSAIGE